MNKLQYSSTLLKRCPPENNTGVPIVANLVSFVVMDLHWELSRKEVIELAGGQNFLFFKNVKGSLTALVIKVLSWPFTLLRTRANLTCETAIQPGAKLFSQPSVSQVTNYVMVKLLKG